MSILTEVLPDYTAADGVRYPVHTDFRNWIRIETLLSRGEPTPEQLADALYLCYDGCLPPNIDAACRGLFDFYACGKKKSEKSGKASKNNIYDFDFDAEYIYSAFLSQYKVDLQNSNLHWWTFRALFAALDESNRIVEIMGYRAADISKIKDKKQRAYIIAQKRKHALPDMRTELEKQRDMQAVFDRLI